MSGLTVIETRRAGPGEPGRPVCGRPIERGQRIALIHGRDGHHWWHVRHLAERQPDHPEE